MRKLILSAKSNFMSCFELYSKNLWSLELLKKMSGILIFLFHRATTVGILDDVAEAFRDSGCQLKDHWRGFEPLPLMRTDVL